MAVLVLDCQSTGARPRHGALLELAWCSTRAASVDPPAVTTHLLQLPEGARIPPAVSRVTGITREHLADAVAPEQAYRELLAFAATVPREDGGEVPTVIHYASFEKAWLQHLGEMFAGTQPADSLRIVCTHEIAKRLLPLPRQGLRPLAGYYGFSPELVRRSEGHVAATVHVWRHLVAELADRGVSTWRDLVAWLRDTPVVPRKRRVLPMNRAKRLSLPDKPGVYRLLRSNGDVLYVGKAASLKQRVNTYFTKRRGHTERTMEMLSQAQDVSVTVTETAVEAALLETDIIKQHRPPYNVQLRDETRHAWFVTADLREAATAPDARFRLGPLPSRFALSSYATLRALLVAGEPAAARELARATAMPADLGPGQAQFDEGAALFAERYALATFTHAGLMSLSKRLLALSRAGKLDEGAHDPEGRSDGERSWDPARVARHLERVVMQAGQLMRRARWLCLLSDASISWQIHGAPVRRLLVVENARIVARFMLPSDRPAPIPAFACRGHHERRAAFDIAAYDRLRVLSTELKRLCFEACEVDVRLSDRVVLTGAALGRLLDAV